MAPLHQTSIGSRVNRARRKAVKVRRLDASAFARVAVCTLGVAGHLAVDARQAGHSAAISLRSHGRGLWDGCWCRAAQTHRRSPWHYGIHSTLRFIYKALLPFLLCFLGGNEPQSQELKKQVTFPFRGNFCCSLTQLSYGFEACAFHWCAAHHVSNPVNSPNWGEAGAARSRLCLACARHRARNASACSPVISVRKSPWPCPGQ